MHIPAHFFGDVFQCVLIHFCNNNRTDWLQPPVMHHLQVGCQLKMILQTSADLLQSQFPTVSQLSSSLLSQFLNDQGIDITVQKKKVANNFQPTFWHGCLCHVFDELRYHLDSFWSQFQQPPPLPSRPFPYKKEKKKRGNAILLLLFFSVGSGNSLLVMFDLFLCECEFYNGKETIDPV